MEPKQNPKYISTRIKEKLCALSKGIQIFLRVVCNYITLKGKSNHQMISASALEIFLQNNMITSLLEREKHIYHDFCTEGLESECVLF